MLDDQIGDMFRDMHPNHAYIARGRVPSKDEFESTISMIDSNIEYKLNHVIFDNSSLAIYMEGYVYGVVEALECMNWNTNVVHKFLATYLKIKYVKKYPMYDRESWYNTLSRTLLEYYDEEFVKLFMDKHFEESLLPLVN